MTEIVFDNLRMAMLKRDGQLLLEVSVDSGHISFEITLPLTQEDWAVIETDEERAAFLQAALHAPFQLKATRLGDVEQRQYLNMILHAPKTDTEAFLTEIDHGRANGAISNMVRLTCGRDQVPMRNGQWFRR